MSAGYRRPSAVPLAALLVAATAFAWLAWRAGDRLSYHYHVWALVRQVRRRRKEVR